MSHKHGKGIKAFPEKEQRKVRRINHFAKDLRQRMFHQRVVEPRSEDKYPIVKRILDDNEET